MNICAPVNRQCLWACQGRKTTKPCMTTTGWQFNRLGPVLVPILGPILRPFTVLNNSIQERNETGPFQIWELFIMHSFKMVLSASYGSKNHIELPPRVLNVILTAGVVMEIMLVPPVIDRKQGILANLDLWQRRMTDRLLVKPGLLFSAVTVT